MRDDWMGGLLAFVVAAPVIVICCGGGGILLAAILGGIGGWLTGLSAVAMIIGALVLFLIARQVLRHRAHRGAQSSDACCADPGDRTRHEQRS